MCGINGVLSWTRNPENLARTMNRHLGHRGPDGDGVFTEGPLALGHVRLSILDLTNAGAQPMRFNDWALTFNGEIYNFKDLKKELISKGYHFVSRSDTEVLLKAWDCWGKDCLHRLEGMFAFGIYNVRKKQIFICRDSYGVKPLFYSHRDGEFLFSSELVTLIQAQPSHPGFDHDALATFLALHYVPSPQTGLHDIHKLQAGHYVTVAYSNAEGLSVAPATAWHTAFSPQNGPAIVTLDELDKAIGHSVNQQMVSDVPVGAFLSGGVDSSLICYYASKVHREPLHTFSIGLSDAGTEYDESKYAAQAASLIGANHHAVQVKVGGLSENIDEVLNKMGELNADTSVFLNYIVCKEARKYVTVCLNGAGGDELFGGYFRHQALLALDLLNKIPEPFIDAMNMLLRPFPQNRDSRTGNLVRRVIRFLNQRKLSTNDFLSITRQDSVYPQDSSFLRQPKIDTLQQALTFDFRHFLGDNILSFSDKMSMLHGLEVRVPFLDPGVIKLAEHLRNDQRVTLWQKKIFLKQLAFRYFPRNLIYRKKQGFAAPLEVWLRNLTKEEMKSRCAGELAHFLLTEPALNLLIDEFYDKKRDSSLQLYALIVLKQWEKSMN